MGQEAKIQHPPDKRKLEKENTENEMSKDPNTTEPNNKLNRRNSNNENFSASPANSNTNEDKSSERTLSKEEELKKYKAPSQPTVADNIESAIAMLGVGLVNKANRPSTAHQSQLSRKNSHLSDELNQNNSKNVSDDELDEN